MIILIVTNEPLPLIVAGMADIIIHNGKEVKNGFVAKVESQS